MIPRGPTAAGTHQRGLLSVLLIAAIVLATGAMTGAMAGAETTEPSAQAPAPSQAQISTVSAGEGGSGEVTNPGGPSGAGPVVTQPANLDPDQLTGGATVDGPQPLGRPLPPKGQRLADTLVWAFLLALPVVGGVWLALRTRGKIRA